MTNHQYMRCARHNYDGIKRTKFDAPLVELFIWREPNKEVKRNSINLLRCIHEQLVSKNNVFHNWLVPSIYTLMRVNVKRRQKVYVLVGRAVRAAVRSARWKFLFAAKDDGLLCPIVFGHSDLAIEIPMELTVFLPGGFLFRSFCVVPHDVAVLFQGLRGCKINAFVWSVYRIVRARITRIEWIGGW